MFPKVSIVLPVYNVEQWISSNVKSIQAQTFKDWEAIFVIDGSPDASEKILTGFATYDKRIKIITQKNKGQGAARDLGIKYAKGDYLFLLDPDDLIPPNALEIAYQKALKTGADMVVGDYIRFKDNNEPKLVNKLASKNFHEYFSKYNASIFYRKDIKDENFFYHSLYFMVVWMKLFKLETWRKNKISSPSGLTMGEDFMTVKKMCLSNCSICSVDGVLVYYRERNNSATTLRSKEAFGIFKSFDFTVTMYKKMKLDHSETSYLYSAYFEWFYMHLIKYVPYLSIYEFYSHIKKYLHHYKNTNINSKIIGARKNRAIEAMSLPGVIGFMGYLYYMAYGRRIFTFLPRKFIGIIRLCMPKSINIKVINKLIYINKYLNQKSKKSKLLEKIIFHLKKK